MPISIQNVPISFDGQFGNYGPMFRNHNQSASSDKPHAGSKASKRVIAPCRTMWYKAMPVHPNWSKSRPPKVQEHAKAMVKTDNLMAGKTF